MERDFWIGMANSNIGIISYHGLLWENLSCSCVIPSCVEHFIHDHVQNMLTIRFVFNIVDFLCSATEDPLESRKLEKQTNKLPEKSIWINLKRRIYELKKVVRCVEKAFFYNPTDFPLMHLQILHCIYGWKKACQKSSHSPKEFSLWTVLYSLKHPNSAFETCRNRFMW